MIQKQRNINLELLRILAIFFITFGHIHARFLADKSEVELLIMPHAVNCFILISGYFLITAKFKFERVLRIIIETIFYTFTISLVLYLEGEINIKELANSLFPFTPSKLSYWFANKYIALILLSPFIQKACTSITKKQYQILLVTMLLISSTLFLQFPFGKLFGNGFSLIWFITLFITGGYLRLYPYKQDCNKYGIFTILFVVIYNLCAKYLHCIDLGYNSLITYIPSITTFMWFNSIKIANNGILGKTTTFISPHVFAIYLVHVHAIVRFQIIDFSAMLNYINNILPPTISLYLFSTAAIVIIAIIDKLRILLFKYINIDTYTTNISTKLNSIYNN